GVVEAEASDAVGSMGVLSEGRDCSRGSVAGSRPGPAGPATAPEAPAGTSGAVAYPAMVLMISVDDDPDRRSTYPTTASAKSVSRSMIVDIAATSGLSATRTDAKMYTGHGV